MKLNLDEKISAAQTVAIAGHVKPDGDCVGSCLAVCQYIRRYFPQKQVQVFLEPDSPYFLLFAVRGGYLRSCRGGGRAV